MTSRPLDRPSPQPIPLRPRSQSSALADAGDDTARKLTYSSYSRPDYRSTQYLRVQADRVRFIMARRRERMARWVRVERRIRLVDIGFVLGRPAVGFVALMLALMLKHAWPWWESFSVAGGALLVAEALASAGLRRAARGWVWAPCDGVGEDEGRERGEGRDADARPLLARVGPLGRDSVCPVCERRIDGFFDSGHAYLMYPGAAEGASEGEARAGRLVHLVCYARASLRRQTLELDATLDTLRSTEALIDAHERLDDDIAAADLDDDADDE